MKYIFDLITICIVSILLHYPKGCMGLTKRFVSSYDFSNERNWKDGNTPCRGGDVTFSTKPNFQILMNGEVSLHSMDFPFDMEITFGEKFSLQLDSQADKTCKGSRTESEFEVKAKGYWWDPDSWECEGGEVYECSSAVPYIYRVPCLSDAVKMSNASESLYKVIFTDPAPTVKSLQLGNQNMTTSKFFDFSILTGDEIIKIENYRGVDSSIPLFIESEVSCSDVTGCTCHASTPVEEICRHMKWKCPKTTCSSPVKMYGFCCPMCGGEISISHNGSIAFSSIQGLLSRVLSRPVARKIDGYVGKMPDDQIHVYFMPQEDSVDYRRAIHTFKVLFSAELNKEGTHVLRSFIAGGTVAEKLIKEQRSKTTSTITITLFSILIVCLVIVAVYLQRKRRITELPFMFRRLSMGRFSTRSSRSDSNPPAAQVATFSTSMGRSFINPTFNDSESLDSFPSITTLQTSLDHIQEVPCPTQRENPLFGAHMDSGTISYTALDKKTKSEDEPEPESKIEEAMDQAAKQAGKQPGKEAGKEAGKQADTGKETAEEMLVSVGASLEDETKGDEENVEKDESAEEDPLEMLAKSRVAKCELENISETEEAKNVFLESSEPVDQDTLEVIDLSSNAE